MSTFSTGTNFPAGPSPQPLTAENCNNDNIPDLNIPDLGIAPTAVSLKSMTQLSSKAIAFIDAAVPDPQTLIDGVIPETEVIKLETNRNGLEQIAEALQGNKFSIIHIIAHGQPGCVQLGNVELSWENLSYRAGNFVQAVQAWARSLTPNAEIMIYGCNVGQGNIGKAFVNSLRQLTGASVAASENLTGCAAKGGDWELTVTAGTIKAGLAFRPEAIAAYGHVLNTFKQTPTGLTTGTFPTAIVSRDFNGDGRLDLAVANRGSDSVSILLGTGQGNFGTATNLTLGSAGSPSGIVAGNFNGDSLPDLAVSVAIGGDIGGGVYVFLGTGQGNFSNPNNFGPGRTKQAIAAGDFNQDTFADLVVAEENQVSIALGNNQGTFGEFNNVGTAISPLAIAIGDFNGDNNLDVVATNRNPANSVSIFFGTGQGTFGNRTNLNTGTSPSAIEVGDFNADGRSDLAVANAGNQNVSILSGTGQGTFSNPANFNVGVDPNDIAVGDFNADGQPDLAVANASSNNVSILTGTGQGTFNGPFNYNSGGTTPSALAVGDFNSDTRPDIAVANTNSNRVSILLNVLLKASFGNSAYSSLEGDADATVNIPVTVEDGLRFTDLIVPIATVLPVPPATSRATQGSDYTLSTNTLTFPAGSGSSTQNIAVTIKPDNLAEMDEAVVLSFGTSPGGFAGTIPQTTLTIPANDPIIYTVGASAGSVPEGNSGTNPLIFTVSRSGGTDSAGTVDYGIGGTATNGSDYNNIGGTSGATSTNGTINFASGETSKTVTLDVLGDGSIEPDETITVTLSNPVTLPNGGLPSGISTIGSASATTTITNDDSAGIAVNPDSGLITTEAGGTATFTVQLNSQPTANVTVGLSSSNVAEGTVSTPSLTFTPANWSAPQTVTISGVEDNIADGNQTYNIVTAAAVSTDSNYSNLSAADVSVTNSDNETPGITVNPTAGLTTTEAGGTANFSVVLNTQPTAPVTVALSSSNPAEGTVSTNTLSFTPNNWNQAQTVTVTGVGDNIADGDIAYTIVTEAAVSTDSNYSNFNPSDVSVTNSDSDTVGVTVNPASTTAVEGGATGSYTLNLNSQPTAPVTVSFDGGNQISAIAPISFDAANWNIAQTVTVIATDDTVVEGTHTGTINHAVTSTDAKYSGIAIGPVTVAITDNETTPTPTPPTPTPPTPTPPTPPTPTPPTPTPPTPTPPTPTPPTPTPPTPPTPTPPTPTPPTPTPTPTPPTPTPPTPTPTPTPPTPTPTPTPPTPTPPTPPIPTPTPPTPTPTPPTPTPPTPTPLPPVIMPPTIPAGITVDPTSGLVTTEAGGKATFTVKLNTPPTADVRIDLESSNPAEGIVSPPSLNFNFANWNQTQTVTVTGVDDKVVDGDKTYSIVAKPSVSNDRNYSGLNAADAIAVSIDNDRSNDNGGQLPPIDPVTGSQYKPGELLVKLRPGASNDFLGNFQANGEIALENLVPSSSQFDFTPSPLDRWRIVKFSSELDLLQIQENLARDPNVEAVELNYQGSYDFIPNDTRFSELWGLNNTGLEGGTSDADIDASEAWDSQTGDRRIIVAVTDSGVDYNHEDLIANIWTNSGEIPGDGIDNDGNGYTDDVRGYDLYNNDNDPSDDLGHGTHIAGTIGAIGNNRIGVTGINHNVSLIPLKIGSRIAPDLVSITRGISYATTKGADVINASWSVPDSRALFDAISEANSAGVLFVAAAGNNRSNNDIRPSYPANYDLPNVISVAATDRNDQLAFFSNFGASTVDLGAPGRNILSTVPGNNYGFYDGTSMAAPHVAGAAALLLAQDPTLTVAQLRNSILSTVDPLPSLAGRTVSGGRLNLRNVLNPVNRPPVLNIPFREQGLRLQPGASPQLQFTFQNNTFTDPDPGDTLTYTADWYENVTNFEWRNVSGGRSPIPTSWSRISPLPTGMTFDPASRTFRVDDSLQRRNYWIRVTARDAAGASDIAFFDLYNRGRGSVIDGYIAGATVFLDANKNGELDASEPSATTGPKGEYELDISLENFDKNRNGELDPEEGNIVAFGGIDTATGLPLETPVTAPPYATVVTLLTSLVADLIDKGIESDRAESLVKSALSIPANVDITDLDPIAATENAIAGGVETLTAMVKVQNVITQTAALIDGASILENTDTVKAVVSAIVQQIQSGTTLNLSDANQLATIVDRATTAAQQFDSDLNTQQLLQIAPDAAKVMAEANQRIDKVVSNTATASINREVARVQKVALGATSEDLKAVGTGTKSIAQVIAENTGTALDTTIQQTTLPDTPAVAVIEGEIDAIAANSNLTGTDGDDSLSGDSGSDTMAGQRGNDTLSGLGGNDWIHGNQGNDSLDGGDSNDTVYGGKESDNLFGNNGEDILFGNRGQDSLSGGEGNDSLYGGQASDILLGGNGSDFLSGENGDDSLIGGNGSDRFLISANSGSDIIFDFEAGIDFLALADNLTFSQLSLIPSNSATLISLTETGEILAAINGVTANQISIANFI
ncbi:S8 family serine peptidase [Microcoleus sp. D3_18a_C4]|uniref:S8 family serine peptidase n=1 Tax=Microcoleus sp. D3_18a_C4 TaxID=3055332 RepID=UPI002FD13F2A